MRPVIRLRASAWALAALPRRGTKYARASRYSASQPKNGSSSRASNAPATAVINVVESRLYSERLAEAIARYHTNAISTVEVLQTLIELAKDIRAEQERGE